MARRIELKEEDRIILALDFLELKEAMDWVRRLNGRITTFKVGPILFLGCGVDGIKGITDTGMKVFLDLKFHDIPSTVKKASIQVVRCGVSMFTVHALGGLEMMREAVIGATVESERLNVIRPKVIAVTVLTSHNKESLEQLGFRGKSSLDVVLRLAELADKAGVDGLVTSGEEVGVLRREFGDRFILITPGIRVGTLQEDQKRTATPREAFSRGADYIVIGRDITGSKDPEAVLDEIFLSLS
ncbi:MAG: orotidine 5'-phosphate decarboxylase [Deltaproteobacteria bacterium]|jgi:orotidine-5'-phosphate decarboxylase|nr:MAG: orotidine 5'-phosphate decarboxylase [Deltaproteobacteria bacterium]